MPQIGFNNRVSRPLKTVRFRLACKLERTLQIKGYNIINL